MREAGQKWPGDHGAFLNLFYTHDKSEVSDMKLISRVVAAIVISLAFVAMPAHAKFGGGGGGFGGGGRSFGGGGFGGGGFGGGRSFGGGGFGGGSFGSRPSYSPPVSAPAPGGFGGSFGSRASAPRSSQSFGGGFRSGATTTSNRGGISTGATGYSTYSSNRMPPVQSYPTYNGYRASYHSYGGYAYPVYYTHPWSGYSFFWLAPHPWYYAWNPFMPAYYFNPPYMYGGGYVSGGFNWLHFLFLVIIIAIVWRMIAIAIRGEY